MILSAIIALSLLLTAINPATLTPLPVALAAETSSSSFPDQQTNSCVNSDSKDCNEGEQPEPEGEDEYIEEEDDEDEDEEEEDDGNKTLENEEHMIYICEPYQDNHWKCPQWAREGECDALPRYMLLNCHKSCCMQTGIVMGVKQTVSGTPSEQEKTKRIIVDSYRYMRTNVMTKPDYALQHHFCSDRYPLCAFWASLGECDNNPDFMQKSCSFSCRSCEKVDLSYRCPLDDPEVGEDAFRPGQLNKVFERIVGEEEFERFGPVVLSRPASDGNDPDKKTGPWIIAFDSFLTEEECDTLIKLGADQGYERSTEYSMESDGTLALIESKERTSQNSWCYDECDDHPVTRRVMDRIARTTSVPERNMERLQMLRYQVGQFYVEHHDFNVHIARRQCGPRILTLFLYLNDVEEGGGTRFPKLDLTVMPKKGKALLWANVLDEDFMEWEELVHHEALPVLKGEKYGANAWIHLRNYMGPSEKECVD